MKKCGGGRVNNVRAIYCVWDFGELRSFSGAAIFWGNWKLQFCPVYRPLLVFVRSVNVFIDDKVTL